MSDHDTTALIVAARRGDRAAHDRLFARVHDELRRIARRCRNVGGDGETMQPTVLANELYLRFARRFPAPPPDRPESRETFFWLAALAMRTILREHWRMKAAGKRNGTGRRVDIERQDLEGSTANLSRVDLVALDVALDRLEAFNTRWFQVVMHRFVDGRTIEETAAALGVSTALVKSDWMFARAWLLRELS